MLPYDRSERPTPRADQTHYMISEAAEYDLRVAVAGLNALATLCSTLPGDQGVEIDPPQIATIFHVFGEYVNGIVNELVCVFPDPGSGGACPDCGRQPPARPH